MPEKNKDYRVVTYLLHYFKLVLWIRIGLNADPDPGCKVTESCSSSFFTLSKAGNNVPGTVPTKVQNHFRKAVTQDYLLILVTFFSWIRIRI